MQLGNPNEGINGGNSVISVVPGGGGGEEGYLTARILASSSAGSLSPEEARVKDQLQDIANVKHKVFGDMLKVKHEVDVKR